MISVHPGKCNPAIKSERKGRKKYETLKITTMMYGKIVTLQGYRNYCLAKPKFDF